MHKGGSVNWERWSGLNPRAIHNKEEVGEKREWAKDWNKQPVLLGKPREDRITEVNRRPHFK